MEDTKVFVNFGSHLPTEPTPHLPVAPADEGHEVADAEGQAVEGELEKSLPWFGII